MTEGGGKAQAPVRLAFWTALQLGSARSLTCLSSFPDHNVVTSQVLLEPQVRVSAGFQ